MTNQKEIFLKFINAIEAVYNEHLHEDYKYKNELCQTVSDLRTFAGIERDECPECGALGLSMINGECYQCVEGKTEHEDIMAAQEGAYRQAKGF